MNFWVEVCWEAFDDAGIDATPHQIEVVADWVEGAHDNYGTYTGEELIANPLQTELDNMSKIVESNNDSHSAHLYKMGKDHADEIRYLKRVIYDLQDKLEMR